MFFFTMYSLSTIFVFFFFNDTATTEIYTLSLHDALPISLRQIPTRGTLLATSAPQTLRCGRAPIPGSSCRQAAARRSEEHTSELQSRSDLVCRLLLEKKKMNATPRCRCPMLRHCIPTPSI